MDIGIDLGTATVIIYINGQGIVLKEPSAIAVNAYDNTVLKVGSEAFAMLGKNPDKIQVVMPLKDGVICDYDMAEAMIKYFIKKIMEGKIVKPRIAICVPSNTTSVESNAVVDVAVSAGARKVYLIEEPIAAAIGAGLNIRECNGQMIVDIGGGTADIAIISLSGIVNKISIKDAGNRVNEDIIRYVRSKYSISIGEKTAENAKIAIANFYESPNEETFVVKGINVLNGLPAKQDITRNELVPIIRRHGDVIVEGIRSVLEKTPPELVGDIARNGLIMTGGGSLIGGYCEYIEAKTGIKTRVAENPTECVAIGTGKSFEHIESLFDGFENTPTYNYE
ncbi:MAG: rod shape-determining protein [Oscillospiraceae bacterium]|nr:rod shape-determining protein [Oscillospiraceae bacterium]